jgi:pre-mRNA-processing factor 39
MNSENVFEILERVIQIPLHQYARYYQKYSELMASVPTRELVTDQELELLTDKVRNENTELSQEEVDNQVRQQIFVQKADIHAKTKKGVQERWTFESMVKRSYFHIKPLDDAQKSNWTKYLDWEEEHGDLARIYALYERCLVPCVCCKSKKFRRNTKSFGTVMPCICRVRVIWIEPIMFW